MNFQYSVAEYIQDAAYCSNLHCGGFKKAERSAPFFNVREAAVNGCSEDRGITEKSTRGLPARKSIQKTEVHAEF